MTHEKRERIRRCVAHFLIGHDPSAAQAEVVYSILGALSDDHLAELDAMVHDDREPEGLEEPTKERQDQ